ncbi:MAG: GNAT family N-acetyltransferase [Candidatus Bathyarchaeota archaeon]|nr:GNAT family N-acetyltransferase [Candidatus Bathyarchaeota archaeon]
MEHEKLILGKYRKIEKASQIIKLILRKGEENLLIKHPIIKLSIGDAEAIVALKRRGIPEVWGGTTAEQVASTMNERLWLGIKLDGSLVSVGGARLEDWGSNIGSVVTHESYRNRGYATSVVSALVEQILQRSDFSLIHVLSDNPPAIKAYTKVGFKPYKKYFFAKAERL